MSLRSRCCRTSRLFFFHKTFPPCYIPRTVLNPAIDEQEDSLVDWLNNVLSLVMSPNVTVEVSSTKVTPMFLPSRRARRSQSHLCLWKLMRDQARECWLHRCLRRRETPPSIYHSNTEKCCVTLITHSSHGETFGDVLTQTEIEPRPKK